MPHPIERLKSILDKSDIWEDEVVLSRNDVLIRKGELVNWIYFVKQGVLQIGVESTFQRHIVRFAYEGSLFAPLDSFFRDTPTIYFVEAIRKTKIIKIRKERFRRFLLEDQEHTKLWKSLLEDLVLQQMEREIDLLHDSPKDRYRRVLQRSPQLFQQVPNKYIASYLRMTPETLSRLKKEEI